MEYAFGVDGSWFLKGCRYQHAPQIRSMKMDMATVDVNRHDYFPANSDIQVSHTDYMMKNWLITSYSKHSDMSQFSYIYHQAYYCDW